MTCSRIGECYIFGQSASRAAMGILGTNGIKKSDFGNYFGYKLGQDLYVEGKIRPWFSFSALQILSNGTLVTISPYNATTDTEFSFFDPVSVLFGFNPTSGNYDTTFGISGSKAFDFVRNSEDTPLGLEIDSEDNIYIGLLNTVYNFSGNTYKVSINKTNSSPALSSTFTPLVLTYTGYRAGMQYLVDEVNYRIYLATSVLETTSGTDKIYIHAIDSKTGAYVNTFGTNGILQLTPASANNLSYVSSKYLKFDGHGRLIVGMSAYDSNNITSIVFATIK
jgi:hypothetical protein